MSGIVRGIVWLGALIGVCVAPLVFALVGTGRPGQGFWTDLSVALGFVGLALMGLEFALVARIKAISEPFGIDAVIGFHRQIGYIGLAFVAIHVALSAQWGAVLTFDLAYTPTRVWAGSIAVGSLIVLVVTSVWRGRLRLSYEVWQLAHTALAVAVVVAAVTHVLLVNYYVDAVWKRALWVVMTTTFVLLLAWIRVVRPLRLRRKPWVVDQIRGERDRTTVVSLRPVDHPGLLFEPGQFAWITLGRSAFSVTSHPFSFCSSAQASTGSVEVVIKAAGDFTSTVKDLQPGTRVFLDGPHGIFSIDRHEGAGFALIAGGVGIAPVMSMLVTLIDRGDVRPVVVFVGARDWDSIILRDRLAECANHPNVQVVHVLEHPPAGWQGERGYLDKDTLGRHLPVGYQRFQFFACGPAPMVAAVQDALIGFGVDAGQVHTERFNWV